MKDDTRELIQEKNPFNIEKGIPIPLPKGEAGIQGALKRMALNDSVFVPVGAVNSYAASVASKIGKITGKKFTCRSVEGGTRIWRIK